MDFQMPQLPSSDPSQDMIQSNSPGMTLPAAPDAGVTPDTGTAPQGAPTQNPIDVDQATPMSDDQRKEIQNLLGLVKQNYAKWNSTKFSVGNRVDSARRDMLKQVMQVLLANGVDLSDQNSVAQYLNQLKQKNPDQYQSFTSALDSLLGKEDYENGSAQATSEQPQGAAQAPTAQTAV